MLQVVPAALPRGNSGRNVGGKEFASGGQLDPKCDGDDTGDDGDDD